MSLYLFITDKEIKCWYWESLLACNDLDKSMYIFNELLLEKGRRKELWEMIQFPASLG